MIEWDDTFNTGIDMIDEQHKYLFKLCRKLEILLETPTGVYKTDDAIQLLGSFRNYITFHFYFEEKYLNLLDASDFADHKREHAIFSKQITGIDINNFFHEDYNELRTFLNSVYSYIFNHIKLRDTQLKKVAQLSLL